MNGFGMPAPPMYPQQQQYYQQPQYYPQPQQSYAIDNNGAPVQATTYAPSTPAPIMSNRSLGVNFGGLIGTNASVPMVRDTSDDGMVVTNTKKKSPKKKKDDTPAPTSAEIVNATVYADTYAETNNLLRMAIAQADDLATDLKTEFNMIRASRNMKGKYTYLANISAAMSGLISTKVGAIKEINNSIKAGNDAEYRRFKDMRAMDAQDDSKVIMDMYKSIINTPIGTLPSAQQYVEPSLIDMTVGMNGMVRVDAPSTGDAGFDNYLSNLTPEQNAMLMEGDPYVKEYLVIDQATGKKYFDWRDSRTGKRVPNMPIKDSMFIEDFTIDPRTMTARNLNIAQTLPVIYENEDVALNY